jgi:choline dehydrogenase-like flavoprotein
MDRSNEFDVIVVGSGPGGATVARELSRKGKSVRILEYGDYDPVKGSFFQAVSRAFIPGKSVVFTNQGLPVVRAITTGGSSLIYCATAFPPPVDHLKSHGVDISKEALEVRQEIPVSPLSDDLLGAGPRRFYESARELGYDCRKLEKFIDQEKCRPDCQLCMYGCPHGAKWSARSFVSEALGHGAEMINRARVERVLVESGRAVGVEYKQRGDRYRAYAPVVVVSAGGIGTPMILRNSGIPGAGFDFFFDPLIFVYGKVKGVQGGRAVPMSTGIHYEDEGFLITDFNMPQLFKIAFDLERLKPGQALSYADVIPVMVKIRDGLSGEITPRGWVKKPLTEEDREKLDRGAAHAARILSNAGATGIYRSWVTAAHPGGTVKIGKDLDTNLQTGYENLYVCDCSVIPEEWGLPPTWTIVALAKRLVRHLSVTDRPSQAGEPADARR